MYFSSQIIILLILFSTNVLGGRHKYLYHHSSNSCPYRNRHEHAAIPYSSGGEYYYNNNDDEETRPTKRTSEEPSHYQEVDPMMMKKRSGSSEYNKQKYNRTRNDNENEVSEYFLKAYFPELNDFYPGTSISPQDYHISIQPNLKEIRMKLAKKIIQTTNDFAHAIKTIRTMLNEETVVSISSLMTLPSNEIQFFRNVIKILKESMESVVRCVSTAGNRLMALPKRWTISYQQCIVDEFKESWGIVESVHNIFQNAVYYIKNFILKLETCLTHEEFLRQWCINDIFNDVPAYVQDTVTKLNRELDSGVSYLRGVPSRAEICQMTDDAEKKLLLPFMIIREMVKCVLSSEPDL